MPGIGSTADTVLRCAPLICSSANCIRDSPGRLMALDRRPKAAGLEHRFRPIAVVVPAFVAHDHLVAGLLIEAFAAPIEGGGKPPSQTPIQKPPPKLAAGEPEIRLDGSPIGREPDSRALAGRRAPRLARGQIGRASCREGGRIRGG